MLRIGLSRRFVAPVVAVCAISDLLLILAGVAGIGTIIEQAPSAIDVIRWLGVAFLTWYGVSSLLRARIAPQRWRRIHMRSYILFQTSTIHALSTGTDARRLLPQPVAIGLGMALVGASLFGTVRAERYMQD